MKPLLLTFDVEEFDLPLELGRHLDREDQIRFTARGLRRIMHLLRRHEVPATFFVTGEFASARPELIASLAADDHEVAVHGLAHGDDYGSMPPAEALARLRRAREIVATVSGSAIAGVRTPRLRACAPGLLRDAGFDYDASAHPTWIPGRYNGLALPRRPWIEEGLWRIPISVLPGLRLPVSWLWYRVAGARTGGAAARLAEWGAPYLHLYFHPWEAVPLHAFRLPPPLAVRTGVGFLRLLDGILTTSVTRLRPMTVGEYARGLGRRGAMDDRGLPSRSRALVQQSECSWGLGRDQDADPIARSEF